MHRTLLTLVFVALNAIPSRAEQRINLMRDVTLKVQNGDLLFLDLDCGELCDAIEDVTQRQFNVQDRPMSHVGIIFGDKKQHQWWVYEAYDGVERTALDEALSRVDHDPRRFWIKRARLRKKEKQNIRHWIQKRLGDPYDEVFMRDNGKYYCSELIVDAFRASLKRPIFEYQPMYFGDVEDPGDDSARVWQEYFLKHKHKIPIDEPGMSPLGMYIESSLETVWDQK